MKVNTFRYLKRIKTTGTVSGSSIFLINSITSNINPDKRQVIVELGGGTGNVTAHILKKMHPDSIIYCFEIEEDFITDLERINDPRFHLVRKSALDLLNFVKEQSVDVIISTLPLTLFKPSDRECLLVDCHLALKPDGIFRQFLYSFQKEYFQDVFDDIKTKLAVINLPPAIVYSCSKR